MWAMFSVNTIFVITTVYLWVPLLVMTLLLKRELSPLQQIEPFNIIHSYAKQYDSFIVIAWESDKLPVYEFKCLKVQMLRHFGALIMPPVVT